MKRLFSALLLISVLTCVPHTKAGPPAPATPGGPFRHIIVRLTNGATINAGATDILEITPEATLRVGSGETLVEYQLSEIAGWHFLMLDNIITSVQTTVADNQETIFELIPGRLTIKNIPADATICLNHIDGTPALSPIKSPNGEFTIDLTRLNAGIYIATVGGKHLKFNIR